MLELKKGLSFRIGSDILISNDIKEPNKLCIDFLTDDFFLVKLRSGQQEESVSSEVSYKINVFVANNDLLSFFVNGTHIARLTVQEIGTRTITCLLYTSPSPRD